MPFLKTSRSSPLTVHVAASDATYTVRTSMMFICHLVLALLVALLPVQSAA